MHGLTLVDVEGVASVVLYGENGAPLRSIGVPQLGDNGAGEIDLRDIGGVFAVRVVLDGSGALDEVFFTRECKGAIGSTIWYDRDGDGVRALDEPGLPGVEVSSAERLRVPDRNDRHATRRERTGSRACARARTSSIWTSTHCPRASRLPRARAAAPRAGRRRRCSP